MLTHLVDEVLEAGAGPGGDAIPLGVQVAPDLARHHRGGRKVVHLGQLAVPLHYVLDPGVLHHEGESALLALHLLHPLGI
jgi:hypothetical protein